MSKIGIHTLLFGGLCLSGCIVTEIPEDTQTVTYTKIVSYSYAMMCFDAKDSEEHYFSTQSYVPLPYQRIYQLSAIEGEKLGIDLAQMSCSQIEVEEIPEELDE